MIDPESVYSPCKFQQWQLPSSTLDHCRINLNKHDNHTCEWYKLSSFVHMRTIIYYTGRFMCSQLIICSHHQAPWVQGSSPTSEVYTWYMYNLWIKFWIVNFPKVSGFMSENLMFTTLIISINPPTCTVQFVPVLLTMHAFCKWIK